ncbi:MAG: hypothetical protein PVJ19_06180 [Desulfobacteraceae bacterium]|jgi:uncharacterized coiled-coil protein SlyX
MEDITESTIYMVSREDKVKRDRYWSVMLVGDHGRVIPFRHFKGLAISICGAFILILIAFLVLAFFYTNQLKTIAALESQVAEAQLQNSKLRDEKDHYLTKLALHENQKAEKPEEKKPDVSSKSTKLTPAPPPKVEEVPQPPPVEPVKKAKPAEKQTPKIKQMAEIRKFSVSYDPDSRVIKAQFRIYNRSEPKRPLSGKSSVVFKHLDEPPVKWLPIPAVSLNDGKPPGDKGQTFQIRNYLTMKFNSYRHKAPAQYNSVTAYVFSDDGQLLASKDFAVNIDVPPPVKRDPIKPTPKPAPTPTATTTPKKDENLQDPSRTQDDKTQEDVVPTQIPTADDNVKMPGVPASEPSADQPSGGTPPESMPAPGVQKDSLPTTQ